MNASLLKRLDGFVGPLLARLFWKKRAMQRESAPRSILVIRPGGIGDAVLLVPALKLLKSTYPDCSIDILAEKRNAAVFGLCPGIRCVYRYDSLSGLAEVFRRRYDSVIDTEQSYRLSAVIARMTRAPQLIGFAGNARTRLFTHPVAYCQEQYEVDSFVRLLEPLGVSLPTCIDSPFLTPPTAAVEAVEGLLAPLSSRAFVALFPGASVAEKQWGTHKFRALASLLFEKGIAVVIVGGEDTRSAGDEISREGVALNLAGRASLGETAAVIGKGRVLVSGDSGLLHIAAGLDTPTVSLFGPSDPRKWSPKGERHRVFSTELPCAPCSLFGTIPPCATLAQCMGATTPDEVAEAVMHLLQST